MAIKVRLATADDAAAALELEQRVWSAFYAEAHGAVGLGYDEEMHVVAVDEQGRIVGTADACKFDWDGQIERLPAGGWREVVVNERAAMRNPERLRPRFACAMGVTVDPTVQRSGLGRELLLAMKHAALAAGYEALAAPVRPSDRWRCPEIGIERYLQLRLADGRHFDRWLRIHEAVGGTLIAPIVESQYFHGTREEWERWTGLKLPSDGHVLIEGATAPLELEDGVGWLIEDGVWVLHRRA